MERTKITVEELLERYTAGERNFEKIILEYADLSGVELRNREHPKFAKSPQARSLGLILQSPPSWAKKSRSPRRWALFL